MPLPKAHRKSGTRKRKLSPAQRKRRDERILEKLLKTKSAGEEAIRLSGKPKEPLLVYSYLPFPLLFQNNNKKPRERMSRWDELTPWMKVQICILAFSGWENGFQTFNIGLHQKKVGEWLRQGKDIRATVRDRLRKELDRRVGRGREFLFVVEGISKKTKAPTKLHIHGGIMVMDESEKTKAIEAAQRAAGQGVKGYPKERKSTRAETFYGGGAKWGNYILKFVDIEDERLAERRLAMSQSAIAAGKEFWNLVTGRWGPKYKLRHLTGEQGLLED